MTNTSRNKMKFILAIAVFLLIGSASAQQHPQQPFIDSLIKQGESLLSNAKLLTESLRQQGRGNLVNALENEIVMVEALVLELKVHATTVNNQNIHQIHIIEEELLHREDRISEELDIIINRVVPAQHANLTATEVIARGETIIKNAQDELKKLTATTREARTIEAEVQQVQALLNTVKLNPTTATTSAVEQLARHEATLDNLVKRAKAQEPVVPAVPAVPAVPQTPTNP